MLLWRFRGTPYHLDRQGERLGLSKVLTDRARHNPEIYRVNTLLGQLNERYHHAPKDDGRAVLSPPDLAQVRGTLGQCEIELEKLHALASASATMLAEAYTAFGLDGPVRPFRVACDFDAEPTVETHD